MIRRVPTPPPVELRATDVARRGPTNWTLRPGPFRMTWTLDDLVAADGLNVRVVFSASVEVLPDAAERTLFLETFGKSDAVTEEDLRTHLEPSLRSAATHLAVTDTAEKLVDGVAESRWVDALRTAAEAVAFGCGLRVSSPMQVLATSEALDHRRRSESHRVQSERDAEGRLATAKHTAAMLREWQSMHSEFPSLSPGELLNRLAPADRAATVTDVPAAAPAEPARFWAVAGSSLIRLDWNQSPLAPVTIAIPPALGPLRSVRVAGGRLLVGARRGVWVLSAEDGSVQRQLIDVTLGSDHGFTAAVDLAGTIWASHRDAGLVGWRSSGDEPAHRIGLDALGGPPVSMHRSVDGSSIGVGAGDSVLSVDGNGEVSTVWSAPAPVVASLAGNGTVDVICRNGSATQLDGSGRVIATRATALRAVAACRLPWLWSYRLLICDDECNLRCYGWEDDIVTQYAAPQGVGRALAATASKVLAVSADRNVLLGWDVSNGRNVAVDVKVGVLARARAADVTLD